MSARAWLSVLAASALAFLLYGYSLGHHNHAIQLPLVRARQDPALFPGDAFVETLDGYTSALWVVVAGTRPRAGADPSQDQCWRNWSTRNDRSGNAWLM